MQSKTVDHDQLKKKNALGHQCTMTQFPHLILQKNVDRNAFKTLLCNCIENMSVLTINLKFNNKNKIGRDKIPNIRAR